MLSGRASFTVGDELVDAPQGTLVFVRDPAIKRAAEAVEPGTTVLVAGATAGEAFTPSGWEVSAEALRFWETKEYDKAIELLSKRHAELPDNAVILYNLACAESLAGRPHDALAHLEQAIVLNPPFRKAAQTDVDFDPIRGRSEVPGAEIAAARRRPAAAARPPLAQRRHRVRLRPRDDEHRSVSLAGERVDEQLEPECEREGLVRLLAAERDELLGLRRAAQHVTVGDRAHRDVGDERLAVRARDRDRQRVRARERRAAVGMRQPRRVRSRSGRRRARLRRAGARTSRACRLGSSSRRRRRARARAGPRAARRTIAASVR